MFDLIEELAAIVALLDRKRLPYALCGGLALAVHGAPRATVDIDLLIREEDEPAIREAVREAAYTLEAEPMQFAGGAVQLRRLCKLEDAGDEVLVLDLMLVTELLEEVWGTRQQVDWDFGKLWVVDRAGLIRLKTLRDSPQDRADLERLTASEGE